MCSCICDQKNIRNYFCSLIPQSWEHTALESATHCVQLYKQMNCDMFKCDRNNQVTEILHCRRSLKGAKNFDRRHSNTSLRVTKSVFLSDNRIITLFICQTLPKLNIIHSRWDTNLEFWTHFTNVQLSKTLFQNTKKSL